MLLSTKGVVLQSIKYGDNSLISKVFTLEKGLISVISNRPKTKKNKTKNYLQPLALVHLVCFLSNNSSIHRLKEISFVANKMNINEDVSINAIRFFLAEFLNKVIKEEEQNIPLYSFLELKIQELYHSEQKINSFHINFLIELFDQIGIQPNLNPKDLFFDYIEGCTTSIKPTHNSYCLREEFYWLLKASNGEQLEDRMQRSKLLDVVLDYYNAQLDGEMNNLKSKAVLEAVFS